MLEICTPVNDTDNGLRQHFLDGLVELQDMFESRGVEYRIIGSLATSAYTEDPGSCSLDFNRKGAVKLDQRVPDIDLIVPRSELPIVREFRS